MPSARDAVRLDEEEVAAFLAGQAKVQVATLGPDGAPHLTTLFYVLEEGRIAFWTYRRSQKVVNLRRDPRISCLVEDGAAYDELRGVSLSGTARLVEDVEEVCRIGERVVVRMTGSADLGDAGRALVAHQARKRVVVLVEPTRVASWDHRKAAGTPATTGEGSS